MRELNPDHLRAFADVAELGSFTAAAARLNLTQPAVSLQVRQLERRLGVRLLERVGRRALPTLAGEELLEHARRIEAAVGDAIAAMTRHRAEAAGRVRIGTGATACIYLLPPALRTVRAARPALQIIVHTGSTPEILDAVEENRLDLALVTLPVPGRALVVTPVVEDEQVAIFPADGTPPPAEVTPAALAERPLVLYETGAHTRRLIDAWFLDGASLRSRSWNWRASRPSRRWSGPGSAAPSCPDWRSAAPGRGRTWWHGRWRRLSIGSSASCCAATRCSTPASEP